MKVVIPLVFTTLAVGGCATAAQHRADVQDDSMDRVTVGTIQREINIGMSGSDVAARLGSPNIVSTDEQRDEVWIYDKLATDVVYSESRGGVLGVVLGGGADIGAGGIGVKTHSAGATSKSQRSLTVVIKFDSDDRVRDFAYHTSRF